jgi:hypothetical protein
MSKLPFFKFDASAWLTGNIRFLNPEEQGMFVGLCSLIWFNGGSYKIDEFTHRHLNTNEQAFNECLHVLTHGGFVLNTDGILTVKFLSEQLDTIETEREKKSKAGRASAEKRAKVQQVSTNKKEERRKKIVDSREKKEDKYTLQFSELWKAYGMKGSKKVSFERFKKLSEIDKGQAVEAVAPYLLETPEKQYRKDLERYLSHRVFEGVLERQAAGSLNGVKQDTREVRDYGL